MQNFIVETRAYEVLHIQKQLQELGLESTLYAEVYLVSFSVFDMEISPLDVNCDFRLSYMCTMDDWIFRIFDVT